MVEAHLLPIIRGVASRAVLSRALVLVLLPMTGVAIGGGAGVKVVDVTVNAGDTAMAAR